MQKIKKKKIKTRSSLMSKKKKWKLFLAYISLCSLLFVSFSLIEGMTIWGGIIMHNGILWFVFVLELCYLFIFEFATLDWIISDYLKTKKED